MATKYRAFDVKFDRGLNLDENPSSLENGDLIEATNAMYSGTRIGTRPGIQRDSEYSEPIVLGTGKIVQGGYEFRKDNDATRKMMTVVGTAVPAVCFVLDTDNTGPSFDPAVVLTSGAANVWTFAQHDGKMYAAGGGTKDTPWYYDGSGNVLPLIIGSIATPDAAIYSPRYIFSKWNRLFTSGFTVISSGAIATGLESNPMIVRYSSLNQPTSWPVANTFGGSSAIGALSSYGDEYLTGFGEYTDNDGDWLLLLSNRTIYEIQEAPDVHTPFYISRRGKAPLGCVHQRAFVSLGLDAGDAVYMSEHGIHSLRQSQQFGGREDKFLSDKISPLFESINPNMRRRACGAYWRSKGVVVFAVATGSSTVNDTLLVLDVNGQERGLSAETARWTVWKLTGSSSASYGVNALWPSRTPSNDWVIYGGNEDGDVFYFDSEAFNDLGNPFPVKIRTHDSDNGDPVATKVLGDTYVHAQPGGNYNPRCRVFFDYGMRSGGSFAIRMAPGTGGIYDTSRYDAASYDVTAVVGRTKLYTSGHYNTVSFQFEHSGVDQPFHITRLVHDVAGMGEDIGDSSEAA